MGSHRDRSVVSSCMRPWATETAAAEPTRSLPSRLTDATTSPGLTSCARTTPEQPGAPIVLPHRMIENSSAGLKGWRFATASASSSPAVTATTEPSPLSTTTTGPPGVRPTWCTRHTFTAARAVTDRPASTERRGRGKRFRIHVLDGAEDDATDSSRPGRHFRVGARIGGISVQPGRPHPVPISTNNVCGVVSLIFWSVMIVVPLTFG